MVVEDGLAGRPIGCQAQPPARFAVLLGHGRLGGIGVTAAAMTPCMRLYAFLGQELARGDVAPLYAEWVRTYAAPEFEALAATLEGLLDWHATDTPAVRNAYRRAMELEYGFFDANL